MKKKMKCTYDNECTIYNSVYKKESVLVFDFAIQKYKILNNGWKEYSFPPNIVINDKLFLNHSMIEELLNCLKVFVQTGSLESYSDVTARGFNKLEFLDIRGSVISCQESSSAMEAKLWFGCTTENKVFTWKNGEIVPYEFEFGSSVLIHDRLHLNKRKANQLCKIISEVWENSNS